MPGTDEQPIDSTKEWPVQIDLVEVKRIAYNARDLNAYIDSVLSSCAPDDPPYLSDLLVRIRGGGQPVLIALENKYNYDRNMPEENRFHWHLKVNYDEWGNKVSPGDFVVHRESLKLFHRPGVPMTSAEVDEEKRDGTFEQRRIKKTPYKVDEKGCIKCEFTHSMYFLIVFGIHGKSGAKLSKHPYETSGGARGDGEPIKAPNGDKLHCWYYRYKEVDKAQYAELPIIEVNDDPKRGIDKKK